MTTLSTLPPTFADTRDALQRVAVHIVARARSQATGRFGLRVAVGGFGTPDFGENVSRVRVSGTRLVCEDAGTGGAASRSVAIDGSSLRDLAEVAGVDIDADLDVGHDTPALGDAGGALRVDDAGAAALADWYQLIATALDTAGFSADASPTVVQLWPEHFDVALDAAATPDRRANLGGSPGDGFESMPYAYVGPWTDDRPGDPEFWNAPFGAVLRFDELMAEADPLERLVAFYHEGLRRLAG